MIKVRVGSETFCERVGEAHGLFIPQKIPLDDTFVRLESERQHRRRHEVEQESNIELKENEA